MAHSHDDHSGHNHVWADDLTKNQGLVLGALTHSDGPLSAYDILDKLVERGLAHRLESLNAFVACADEHCHRSGLIAFAICEGCGKVDEFADAVIEERLGDWAGAKGFKVERTTMEIRGRCGACVAA